MQRPIFEVTDSIPLLGCIAFGLIDRGTNLIQVRPSSNCPLSCIFCSTNAGPKSKIRQTEYTVPIDYLVEEFTKIAALKGNDRLEAHIDTVGDPIVYPKLVELVSKLNQVKGVETVSMQTHASVLNEKILDKLSDAGLTRINLSLDALDFELAKHIANTEWYDVGKICELMKYVISCTHIKLLVSPVWVPKLNDAEIPKIIQLTKKPETKNLFPPLGIQKYEIHKHGRKVKNTRPLSWRKFYQQLRNWEKEFTVKLVLNRQDFGIHKSTMLSVPYRRSEITKVEIVGPGWLCKEKLAVTNHKDRCFTIVNAEEIPIGAKLKARIVANKHNLFIAEPW
jgi:uncharacterized Fe-S cluster-containing radical SAM superfamily enzyme